MRPKATPSKSRQRWAVAFSPPPAPGSCTMHEPRVLSGHWCSHDTHLRLSGGRRYWSRRQPSRSRIWITSRTFTYPRLGTTCDHVGSTRTLASSDSRSLRPPRPFTPVPSQAAASRRPCGATPEAAVNQLLHNDASVLLTGVSAVATAPNTADSVLMAIVPVPTGRGQGVGQSSRAVVTSV